MTDTARLTAALAGRYRIERELGAGGMATVYLAYDIRHDRNVALKVLRPELAAVIGADRFLKEIKVTAHLQHPHILGLIDSGEADGLLYYVMPFVEGESLRDRITHEKQLPVEDAVRITCEVASALAYAHRHGVIHRDIKPENILLHEGQTMVADFGIALAVSAGAGTRMTETGMSLGTPHYMSPEQAMGERELTARSDVYALGAVLYELLVGEPPFTGPTAQAIVAKVVTEAPRPLIPQRHTVPPHVEAAVLMALEKLPADRFAGAAAFAEALAHPSIMAVRGARMAVRESRPWDLRQWRRLTVAVAVLAVASGGLAGWGWLRGREPAAVSRFPLVLEGEYAQALHIVAVSPDGAHIAYVNDSVDRLFVRDRDRLESSPIPDGETGDTPFFSPDGEQVAFCSGTPGALRAASLTGGAGRVLVRDSAYAAGGTWSNDGWIYFVGGAAQALLRVRAEGGKPELVARPDTAHDELFFNRPQILPGDRTALVTIWRRRGATDIAAVDIATGKTTVLTRGVEAQYARSGHLIVLAADGSVQAVRFDAGHLTLIGRPMTVLDGVAVGSEVEGASAFALSNTGTFIYQTALPKQRVMRVTRDGRAQPVDTGWSGHFRQSDLSPDGTRLAITVLRGERAEVWVKALGTGTLTRLQYEGTYNYRPTWTPDGRSLLFISDRSGHAAAYRVLADGSAPATLLRDDPSRALDEASLSRDGRWLVYRTESGVGRDIYAIRPGIDSMPTPIATSPFEEYAPTLSPDGRWVAYTSQESGQPEIFVRPFPNAQAARWQISRAGGSEPVWARSGRELFYRNAASDLVAAEVATRPPFRVVAEHVLFSTRDYVSDAYNRAFTVSPDDRSFLFLRHKPGAQSQLIMVTNWFEELKAKVGK